MTPAPQSFTVSSLSKASGVPVPRIKFYLREGLLPSADLSAPKRAFYGTQHVERLRLIQVLREVAALSIHAIRGVCRELDAPRGDLASAIVRVLDTLAQGEPARSAPAATAAARARSELHAFLRQRGVKVRANAPALAELSRALIGLRELLGDQIPADVFAPYLDAMLALAERDFSATGHLLRDRNSAGLAATYGTVLWEPILIILRRLAIEHVAKQHVSLTARSTGARGRH